MSELTHAARKQLAGQLIGSYTAVCLFCADSHAVSAGGIAGASVALQNAGWRRVRGSWMCGPCLERQHSCNEAERREPPEHREHPERRNIPPPHALTLPHRVSQAGRPPQDE